MWSERFAGVPGGFPSSPQTPQKPFGQPWLRAGAFFALSPMSGEDGRLSQPLAALRSLFWATSAALASRVA